MRQLKVLLSAFACRPGEGSELGVGWNVARELARYHEVWVLTQGIHRPFIEAELERNPIPNLRFAYYDLPRWIGWWRREQRGVQPYYYLWQFAVHRVAHRLHREVGFDIAQHVTFLTYSKPCLLATLPVPFIWGPVGGGESAPKAFRADFGLRGRIYEATRDLARWLGEHDPFVRLAARRGALALATTKETATRLRKLGAKDVRVFSSVGFGEEELDFLHQQAHQRAGFVRFVSAGRMLHWKGFHLGLRAFAQAGLPRAEYWMLGDGPESKRLKALAEELGIAHQVKFWGRLSRDETLHRLGESHALVHPSLHESGGLICSEAMSLGCPVVCLDLGGPAVQVTEETGFKIPAIEPEQAVGDLAAAMRALSDRDLRTRMGAAARQRAAGLFVWRERGAKIAALYDEVLEKDESYMITREHVRGQAEGTGPRGFE